MDKITQVNIEGHNYGFVAGQAVRGVSGAQAADYVKTVILPEGASLVEGMLLAVTFVNGNTAGFAGTQKAYSSDGETFYWDDQLTDPITLPPVGCYTMTLVSGEEYDYAAYPVWSINGVAQPFCDSRGHPCGGPLWASGDTVTVLNLDGKYIALQSTLNEVKAASPLPVTSGAVAARCDELVQQLSPVDEVTVDNMYSVTSNAVARALDAGNFMCKGLKRTYIFNKNIPKATWTDLVTVNDVPEPGVYLFRLYINDNSQSWAENLVFIIYFFTSGTNSTVASSINYNQSGHAPNTATYSLRWLRRTNPNKGSIQIYISAGASTIPVQVSVYRIA